MNSVMHKKIGLTGLLLVATIIISFGQGGTSVKAPEIITRLNVGDRVPNIEINNLINTKSSTLNLSALKGKLVLIDFWETTCSNCIKAFPKIEKFRKKFSDKMEVITVTRFSTKEQVEDIRNRFPVLKDFSLPTVIGDDKLYQYFPYKLISHVVWIGSDGIVKAITGTEHITEEYIQQMLEGKPVNWPVKNDLVDFDYNKPLLDFTNAGMTRPHAVYSSAITGSIKGIDGASLIHEDTLSKTITFNHFNQPLITFCKGAVTGELQGDYSLKDVVLEVKDPSRYKREPNTNGYSWVAKGTPNNLYCYSVALPTTLSQNAIKEFIREDLSRWLKITNGVTVKTEDRTVPSLKLVRIKKDDNLLLSKNGAEKVDLAEERKIFNNLPLTNILLYLNDDSFEFPFISNETGLQSDTKVDMELSIAPGSSLEEVRKALHPYGLDLVETTKVRSMYVITEEGYSKK